MGGRGSSSYLANTTQGAQATFSFEDFVKRHTDSYYSDGRIDEKPLTAAERDNLVSQGLNTNIYQQYLEESGDYGEPELVSAEGFKRGQFADDGLRKRLATQKDGETPILYRGLADRDDITAEAMAANTIYDSKYYAGNGVYGEGLYFSTSNGTARTYATDGNSGTGAVMAAYVKKGSKIVSSDQVESMFSRETNAGIGNTGLLSAFARSKGIDVISINKGGETYYNVINRGCLVISEATKKVKYN